jgi:hypothetical protein
MGEGLTGDLQVVWATGRGGLERGRCGGKRMGRGTQGAV